jgi:hypothetical protein
VVLAPMAGITNVALRRLCREQGAGLYVCEMTAMPVGANGSAASGGLALTGDNVAFVIVAGTAVTAAGIVLCLLARRRKAGASLGE